MSIINNIINYSGVSVLKVVEIDKEYIIDLNSQQWSICENKCVKYNLGFPTRDSYKISLQSFYNRFVVGNSGIPENHYKTWTKLDYALLNDFISENYILIEAAADLKRKPESVFNKILEMQILKTHKNIYGYKSSFDCLNFDDMFYQEKTAIQEYYDELENFELQI